MNKLTILSILFFSSYVKAETFIITKASPQLSKKIVAEGGIFLRYLNAFKIELSEDKALEFKDRYPSAMIEKDSRVQTMYTEVTLSKGSNIEHVPWGLKATNSTLAWSKTKGKGIKVCVVDTGVDYTHFDLNVVSGENFTSTDHQDFIDRHGHGTHVAGTIGAKENKKGVVGVAPGVQIIAMKVLSDYGYGATSWVAQGVIGCVLHGANVINMSLGGGMYSNFMRGAVAFAKSNGVEVIAAAGNNRGSVSYPAAYPEVRAISAIDARLNLAVFSNRGGEIEFTAPGVYVLSTYTHNRVAYMSGTSMAAPHVAGLYALKKAAQSRKVATTKIEGLNRFEQGQGLVDALGTVENQ